MIMSSARPFTRLLNQSPGEVLELIQAQVLLLSALWTLRTRPRGELLRPAEPSLGITPPDILQRVASSAIAVDRVARFGLFRPTCLVRAIALENLLRRANVSAASVRVGVLRDRGELLAHAWIELNGRVVGDDPSHVRRFTPLPHFTALPQ